MRKIIVTHTDDDILECMCDECGEDFEKIICIEVELLNSPNTSFWICKECLKKALEMLE